MIKTCAVCGEEKNYDQFHIRRQGSNSNRQSYCKDCSKSRHREDIVKMKFEVFEAYGGSVCKCCGLTGHPAFLAIDHIDSTGAEHRRSLNMKCGGYRFYCWLKRNDWPSGYQVLCHNCNIAKEIMGICPHQIQLPDSVIWQHVAL